MNRFGCFVLGVVVGCVVMQIGLALYLRSIDFAEAAAYTAALGAMGAGFANLTGEMWS